ncbi:MAG: hypothetical protein EAZ57_07050 [Cytophagales bacterium]|nr:MAG: hypothetical protein EAZ67_07860 [Cytophagales bacterium]TAF60459.1 MAG: hypothetical protein EAZ57_07050 [Cytophagales bacterium]
MEKIEQFQKLLTENPQLMLFVVICATIIALLFLLFLRSLFTSTSTVLAVYSRQASRMQGQALSEVLSQLKTISSEAKVAIEELETAVDQKNKQLQELDQQIKTYQNQINEHEPVASASTQAAERKTVVRTKADSWSVFLALLVGIALSAGAFAAIYWQILRK